ncbi:tubby-like protein 8 isoform X2 [Nicotiana tomentosiformis]|uniref:tubby-like protein 8 isoform X2 n=1 Tax=Nicotiana tomentosiformis TaxID=4098 RepID=UPI00051B3D7E|nr:tubby-like protein 8 isoform X2 [Nicotiana tomentosiformis]
MSGFKKIPTPLRSSNSYNSFYDNPLTELRQNRSSSSGSGSTIGEALGVHLLQNQLVISDNKENETPNKPEKSNFFDKENALPPFDWTNKVVNKESDLKDSVLKPSSLQLCIQKNEPESKIGLKIWEHADTETPNSANIWDYSDSEAAPASSWSTLPNRSLLYRPLPIDIGRCTCVIVKESSSEIRDGGTFYSLYTNEGHGRQNRKLAIAHYRRRGGKSEFVVAQNTKELWGKSEDSLIGHVTANLLGSKYHIWDQGRPNSVTKQSKLLGVVTFMPTIATWTGSYRRMKACIPKHQSMQLKSTTQHINGLTTDWEEHMDKVNQLFSKIPHYNKVSRQYELDFRDRGRAGLRIQSSVKNFQLTLENGRQTILQLGRVGKAKYVMDYRYPLTGYQAFCICLASIDSKLCCTL